MAVARTVRATQAMRAPAAGFAGETATPRPAFYRMLLAEFRRASFVGRAPSINTIWAAIESGEWCGERVGGLRFIFVDANGQPLPGKAPTPATGNADADKLIMEWQATRR